MHPMRRQMNECRDQEKINLFLNHARIGFLGLSEENQPYVVPLNFVWYNNKIYFHGATEGRKADILQVHSNVCFTVCEEYGTMAHTVPAHTSTAYLSVMLFGKVARISNLDEGTEAMQKMLDKYVPGYYNRPLSRNQVEKYRSSMGSATAIFCLSPEDLSAKENPLDPDRKFVPGQRAGEK
ncbi:pyridoxamine 5'-phosphate oxidase family protein [Sporolactobacillus shoreae]|nr:pyridoxamine 5'-phosphate oxidase family protein [Sporolactobacillus shoreae]